ncbi:FAD-binding domain-containing protein [Tothia fuscella]|uniref:FAD-binding domain-containing protein n=1 Tax=Tothia fuscella TaxID=1048955 RepID=A0A9P4NK37_9PEZI|nr:FAD-binding domain-containing protein [Tothia fuscella]
MAVVHLGTSFLCIFVLAQHSDMAMTQRELLDDGFSGQILSRESANYAEASQRYSALAERSALYIALPNSAEDISIAVKHAQRAKLPIAVKGGGNHPIPASSVQDGMTIDLTNLNQIVVDDANSRVAAGGGYRWGQVYSELQKHDRVCVGGGVHVVGIGGHLTGGGWGPLTQKYGLACDNVLSATVVVADGRILTASESENPDLFWAIKGGSSQFGVVAQFVIRTFPTPGKWLVRFLSFLEKDLRLVTAGFRELMDRDKSAGEHVIPFIHFTRAPDENRTPIATLSLTALDRSEGFDDLIQQYFPVSKAIRDETERFDTIYDLSHSFDHVLLGGPRRVLGAVPMVTGFWPGMAEEVRDRWIRYTKDNVDVTGSMVALEFHSTKRRNPEQSCFPVQEPTHNSVLITSLHNDPTNDTAGVAWALDTARAVQGYQDKHGKHLPMAANGTTFRTKSEEVWGESFPRLRQVKAKYDPSCVFNLYHPIEPDFSGASSL